MDKRIERILECERAGIGLGFVDFVGTISKNTKSLQEACESHRYHKHIKIVQHFEHVGHISQTNIVFDDGSMSGLYLEHMDDIEGVENEHITYHIDGLMDHEA